MPSLESDIAFVIACAQDLEEFVLSSVPYWPINARPPKGVSSFPRLTLGGLSLARKRILARAGLGYGDPALFEAEREISRVRQSWLSNWERKAGSELPSRLAQWESYLREYREDPRLRSSEYAHNVQWRVMVHLLLPESGKGAAANLPSLNSLDGILRSSLVGGDFCWEADLEKGFPKDEFWYLYGSLKG
jgi:hypothetical protein